MNSERRNVDKLSQPDRNSTVEAAGQRIDLCVIREPGITAMSARKREICWNYGIPPREAPYAVASNLCLTLQPGKIILLRGPSGSGKSSILEAVADRSTGAVWVGRNRGASNRAVVDLVAPGRPLATAMEILTVCGLGEPRLWVRQFRDLSDGERFRASLASAVGEALNASPRPVILCDEFTAILHRRLARALAHNLRKLISRHRLSLIAATAHDDVVDDLQPDQIVSLKGPGEEVTLSPRRPVQRPASLTSRVKIEMGCVRDYHAFGPMHYRHRDNLGFVDRVFLLRETATRDPLGILVFAHAPIELSLRNLATRGRFVRNVRRLNRELRILRRLVMHPDVRGCGLGHWFVRHTLPRVGVRFIECLAAMGEVNPVFERAGLTRVGPCALPKGRMKLLERLRKFKVDPFAPDFVEQVERYPRVRALVEQTVFDWAGALHGKAKRKVRRWTDEQVAQSFRQLIGRPPVYYLWDREGEFPAANEDKPVDASKSPKRPPRAAEEDLDSTRTMQEKRRHRPDQR
ncbi:MAG TPA: hypothetical protein VNT79_02100 [Phycisphaerae bacterium]|nr:hypothetical protein [Phycisphaerae bacterium]